MRGQVSVVVRARSGERTGGLVPARGSQATPRCRGLSQHGARRGHLCGHRVRDSASGWTARLHTAPAFLLVGLALGLAVAALSVIKQIRTYL